MIRIGTHACVLLLFCWSTVFAGGTIDIAAIYALSGVASKSNVEDIRGARLAVDDINRRGGLLGKKLNLVVFDNKSTPIGSNDAARRAGAAGVSAIIGASWSSHSIAIARVAQNMGIPMISSASTHPGITKTGNCIFRVCFTDNYQGRIMAGFARHDLNAATAAVMTNLTSDYSLALAGLFKTYFEKAGGRVAVETAYKHKQENFDNQIRKIGKGKTDVLFLPGHNETGHIAKLAQEAGITAVPIGGDGWSGVPFLASGGSALKLAYFCTHWSPASDSDLSRRMVREYEYTGKFQVQTALAHDAVMILADAIRRAGSSDRAGIRRALAGTRMFKGVTGTISFNADGDPVKSAVIMEIRDGKPRYLKTLEPEFQQGFQQGG